MKTIELTQKEYSNLKELVKEFNSFYENDDEWKFEDLDAQREIGREIVDILETKIGE
jgi:hypothetical protein